MQDIVIVKKSKTGGWWFNYKGTRVIVQSLVNSSGHKKYPCVMFKKGQYPYNGTCCSTLKRTIEEAIITINSN